MILGVGSDIVEIERIRAALDRHQTAFERRVLSQVECEIARSYAPDRRAEFVAGRFAAKEAIAKAVGCGLAALCMAQVTISLGDGGLAVRAEKPSAITELGDAYAIHVSITHSREQALAFAVYERL